MSLFQDIYIVIKNFFDFLSCKTNREYSNLIRNDYDNYDNYEEANII
jgi:hypothetical protein